ncbi:UNVERIFIED_CONTAM: hypothetical protein Sangu_1255400 [Sesamum angustifolium]|uniref:Uncharacterized protein n=1 Tax=Sesamum angustifolium TaxID=2727405 RepID=A0AAW2NIR5_9LAMI
MVNGYPPNGELPSVLDLGTAMKNAPKPFVSAAETLDRVLGEVTTDMKRGPPSAAVIDSITGDLPKEGVQEPKKGSAPSVIDEGLR